MNPSEVGPFVSDKIGRSAKEDAFSEKLKKIYIKNHHFNGFQLINQYFKDLVLNFNTKM